MYKLIPKLFIRYIGLQNSQRNLRKISILAYKYELFKIELNEIIFDMFTIFMDIINGLKSLDKVFTNVRIVRKILRYL